MVSHPTVYVLLWHKCTKKPSKLIFTTKKLLVGCSFASFPKVGTLQLALTYIFTDQFFPTENRAPNTRGTRWEFATSNGYHLSTMDGSNPEDDPLLME